MKFGYARVSTSEQNLDLQLDAIKKYEVDEIYTEKISGTKFKPKLKELLSKLRKGDTLVIWKLDRLGRTVLQLIELAEELTNKGVNFVSIIEQLDTTTAMGKFTFHIFCAVSQMERDVIAERTKAGLEAARVRGRVGGRPKVDKKKIDRALKMYRSKEFSIKEITESTGISKGTLYNYIRKENK